MGKNSGMTPEEQAAFKKRKEFDSKVNVQVKERADVEKNVRKLLLLGSGESGKSTVFKQMIQLYGKGFDNEEDRLQYRGPIADNIITGTIALIHAAQKLGQSSEEFQLSAECQKSCEHILKTQMPPNIVINDQVIKSVETIWAEPSIKATFDRRAAFQIPDSLSYFLNRVREVTEEKFVPNTEDVLRVRVRTTGMTEEEFDMQGLKFRMIDVGGQRNERRKWIHQFEAISAIIFITAISEYDQTCFEDEETNRMVESLNLFEEISKWKWFEKTSVILFLNKRDLFEKKFKTVPLLKYFPKFTGTTVEEAFEFFQIEFQGRSEVPKDIYTHVTTATDTENIKHVFNALRHIIVKTHLGDGGFF